MNNKPSRAIELFHEWQQENPQFFKDGGINEDLYTEAVQSFLFFLRTKRLTLIECEVALSFNASQSTQLSIWVPTVISCFFGFVGCWFKDSSIETTCIAFIISLIAIIVMVFNAVQNMKNDYLSFSCFLQIVLKRYMVLYSNDLSTENKLVELFGGKLANIPANAEVIYSKQIHLSRYYQNAFIITIDNSGQKFNYVIYSNSVNCSIDNFVELCKNQTGKSWNINKDQIDIIKAPIV